MRDPLAPPCGYEDAFNAAVLALNTIRYPDATDDEAFAWLDDVTEGAVATLAALRDAFRANEDLLDAVLDRIEEEEDELMPNYTREDFLRKYHDLDEWREQLAEAYEAANSGEGSYSYADESRADLNEILADLADMAAAIFEDDTHTYADEQTGAQQEGPVT